MNQNHDNSVRFWSCKFLETGSYVMDFKRKNKSQTSGTVTGIEPGVARLRVPHATTVPPI